MTPASLLVVVQRLMLLSVPKESFEPVRKLCDFWSILKLIHTTFLVPESFFVRQEFITIVLLSAWIDLPQLESFEVLEFYAGQARVSRYCARQGFKTGSFDIKYDHPKGLSNFNGLPRRSHMDMNSPAGFMSLVLSFKCTGLNILKHINVLPCALLCTFRMMAQVGSQDDPGRCLGWPVRGTGPCLQQLLCH